ncbi:Z1 domain-containing protein [Gemmatimonadota bacterium Y43]|uniref:Z1 domain-containing protein n=1 Tax=Gaopeijia maritima TaxID=3119007 RepID=UPI00327C6AF8
MADEQIDRFARMLDDQVRQGVDPKTVLGDYASFMGAEIVERIRTRWEEETGRIKVLRDPGSLKDPETYDWYTGPRDTDPCWPSLESYLLHEKRWNEDVVDSIDRASTKILSHCPPPGMGRFATRGLVLGYVQSGKTANFTALISKAADAGYHLFIVLGGLFDSLRNQTQRRLDRELSRLNPDLWLDLTGPDLDFGDHAVNADFVLSRGKRRSLGVLKKNHSRLERLIKWLRGANPNLLETCPVMIIDDEADQASLNSSRYADERTRINQLLIELLEILPRHAYVGYTATPFANVLVDPTSSEDLYPRNFIVTLPKPPEYFGAERIFGRSAMVEYTEDEGADPIDVIRRVRDDEVAGVKPTTAADVETFEPALVASLETAVQYFWLACAARMARGQGDEHSTMLIHTHQRILVHRAFLPMLEDFRVQTATEVQSADAARLRTLREIWADEWTRAPADDEFPHRTSFEDLQPHLVGAIDGCAIIMENGAADERLDYEDDHRRRIVVGGTTLSRGLTLEGLVVSYFVRSAGAYDTLLQMGRWFGYRIGYEDLPRIWITEELEEAFRTLALVEAEIRADIKRYEDHGLTPSQLAVRIRKHPSLAITSRYRMMAARDVMVSYSGTRTQTTAFHHRDSGILNGNLQRVRAFLATVQEAGCPFDPPKGAGPGKQLAHGVPAEHVRRLVESFVFHPQNKRFDGDRIADYIGRRTRDGELEEWTVAVIGQGGGGTSREVDLGLPLPVRPVGRSRLREVGGENFADIGVLTSSVDWTIDLPSASASRERPLLLIYLADKDYTPRSSSTRKPLDAVEDVAGLALAFPAVDPDQDHATYVSVDLPTEPDADYEPIPEVEDETNG